MHLGVEAVGGRDPREQSAERLPLLLEVLAPIADLHSA